MYYQVKDNALAVKPSVATGIGLAVSRQSGENMGGDITVIVLTGQRRSTFAVDDPQTGR